MYVQFGNASKFKITFYITSSKMNQYISLCNISYETIDKRLILWKCGIRTTTLFTFLLVRWQSPR